MQTTSHHLQGGQANIITKHKIPVFQEKITLESASKPACEHHQKKWPQPPSLFHVFLDLLKIYRSTGETPHSSPVESTHPKDFNMVQGSMAPQDMLVHPS